MVFSNAAENVDNVGTNIFTPVRTPSQMYGPRLYIHPSFKQCNPPRVHHFKKNGGVPPPGRKPSVRTGEPKPGHKQSFFYKVIKHHRRHQLEAHPHRPGHNHQPLQPCEDIINSSAPEHGWLDQARANLHDADLQHTPLPEEFFYDPRKNPQEERELEARKEAEERHQREQRMRRSIALSDRQRRQGLRNSRRVRLIVSLVSRGSSGPGRGLRSGPERRGRERREHERHVRGQEPRDAELETLQRQRPSTIGEGEIEQAQQEPAEREDIDEPPLVALSWPQPLRSVYRYAYTDFVDGKTWEAEVEGAWENPIEARWQNLERYEVRDHMEQETRWSWRNRDDAQLTADEQILRDEEDLERERRDFEREMCQQYAERERSRRKFAAQLTESDVSSPPVTPAGSTGGPDAHDAAPQDLAGTYPPQTPPSQITNAAADAAGLFPEDFPERATPGSSAPSSPLSEPPPTPPNAPGKAKYRKANVELDSTEDT